MKPLYRGIAVALLQCLIVLGVAGKYALERQRLPRVWVKAAPVDPNLPVRPALRPGRPVSRYAGSLRHWRDHLALCRWALGEELWVEVSVPHQGPPRPLRLGLKKDGVLTPLDLR